MAKDLQTHHLCSAFVFEPELSRHEPPAKRTAGPAGEAV